MTLSVAQVPKCDANTLLAVSQNMDNLSLDLAVRFVDTFDKSCRNNVEFTEWSNKLLFQVIKKQTSLYFKALLKATDETKNEILYTFSSPLLDYNYQEIYDKVKATDVDTKIRQPYLDSLVASAKREGIELTE